MFRRRAHGLRCVAIRFSARHTSLQKKGGSRGPRHRCRIFVRSVFGRVT